MSQRCAYGITLIMSLLAASITTHAADTRIARWTAADGSVSYATSPPPGVSLYKHVDTRTGAVRLVDTAGNNLGLRGDELTPEAVSMHLRGNWHCECDAATVQMNIDHRGQVRWVEQRLPGPAVLLLGEWDIAQRLLTIAFSNDNLAESGPQADQGRQEQKWQLTGFDGRQLMLEGQGNQRSLSFVRVESANPGTGAGIQASP